MGKKSKKKVLWRRLSIDESQNKSGKSSDSCEDETCPEFNTRVNNPPQGPPQPSHRRPLPRRPFHSNNFHPKERRFHQQFNRHSGPPFERGSSLERSPATHAKYLNKPFHSEHYPSFYGPRRKFLRFPSQGKCGRSQLGFPPKEDQVLRGQSSDDEGAFDRQEMKDDELGDHEGYTDPHSQPVHTVLIDNEEYTKIQTPRQEVIFKKSSLDKRRGSIDLGSTTSTCGSTAGCDQSLTVDQCSLSESVEEPTPFQLEGPLQGPSNKYLNFYEDSNLFAGEPGKPPLAGVVMQQTYPGGPMVSIPVHWTPFLDPGFIPGDTALTTLDPSFTHVIDPNDILVDPAHVLPIQHDANGCPVTVQVKVNAKGEPIEIEPSAFTVSLSTLQPHMQEALFGNCGDLMATSHVDDASKLPWQQDVHKTDEHTCTSEEPKVDDEEEQEITRTTEQKVTNGSEEDHKESEDSSSDSQYASMSETSTNPASPSGELYEPSGAEMTLKSSKSVEGCSDEEATRLSAHSDSVFESEAMDSEDTSVSSLGPHERSLTNGVIKSVIEENQSISPINNTKNAQKDKSGDIMLRQDSESSLEPSAIQCDSASKIINESSKHTELSKEELLENTSLNSSDAVEIDSKESTKKKNKKQKKIRSLSMELNVSSRNSSIDFNSVDSGSNEDKVLKCQSKRLVVKTRKEKKRQNKEKCKQRSSVCAAKETTVDSDDQYPSSIHSSEDVENENDGNSISMKLDTDKFESIMNRQNVSFSEQAEPPSKSLEGSASEETLTSILSEEITSNEEETQKYQKDMSEETNQNQQEEAETQPVKENKEEYLCKQGFVMVPILTPYYDPAVIYGYPLVVPENLPTCSKKKKKKFRRKYEEGGYLDPELYVGEPYVATPDGYLLPVEAPQMCQVHCYPYPPNCYPHMLADEGFVSFDHPPPYFKELSLRTSHNGGFYTGSRKKHYHADKFTRHCNEEKKLNEKAAAFNPSLSKTTKAKESPESYDSGVSEWEEQNSSTSRQNSQDENMLKIAEEKIVVEMSIIEDDATTEEKKNEECRRKKNPKKKIKKKKDTKSKKTIIEIIEPDFSSYSCSPTLKCESKLPNGAAPKLRQAKKTKIRRKKHKDSSHSEKEEDLGCVDLSAPVSLTPKEKDTCYETESCLAAPDDECAQSTSFSPQVITEGDMTSFECCVEKEKSVVVKEKKSRRSRKKSIVLKIEECIDKFEEHFGTTTTTTSPQEGNTALSNGSCNDDVLIDTCKSLDKNSETLVSVKNSIDVCVNTSSHSSMPIDENSISEEVLSSITLDLEGASLKEEVSVITSKDYTSDAFLSSEIGNEVISGLQELGMTKAVAKWVENVTPEKAFYISPETRDLLLSTMESTDDEDVDDEAVSDHESSYLVSLELESKNGPGNPFTASPNDNFLGERSARVAPSVTAIAAECSVAAIDAVDECDIESLVSISSRNRLYSSSSNSSFPPASQLEEHIPFTDPRIYDPTAYSKYYQLILDVQQSSKPPTRESSLSPAAFDVDGMTVMPESHFYSTPLNQFTSLTSEAKVTNRRVFSSECNHKVQSSRSSNAVSSVPSSGIGSSLASTPNLSPDHHKCLSTVIENLSPNELESYKANVNGNFNTYPLCSVM